MKVALGYIFKFVANYSLQSMLSKEPSLTFFIKMSLTLTETSCGQDRLLLVGTSRAATLVMCTYSNINTQCVLLLLVLVGNSAISIFT